MRVLIDCTQIPLARMGVGVYADGLVRELVPTLGQHDTLFILAQSDDATMKHYGSSAPNVRAILVPSLIFRRRIFLALFEQFAFPLLAFYYRLDLIHSIHYTFPLFCGCKRVVTIHDLTHSLMPEVHTFGRRVIMPFFSRQALRRAQGLLFVSSSTRDDFQRVFGAGKQLRFVSPLGVSSAFFVPPPADAVHEALERHGIRDPYVLFVGTIEPRKNVERLIEAFELLAERHPRCLLVIAGGLGWSYETILAKIETSARKQQILRLGYISSADKHALLAGCEVLVYPSLYEGFGLPVLEGMAMGKPVVTSNVSSMPEVAGDGAIMIDPYSTEQLAEALDQVLSNGDFAKVLSERGRRQASKFSWERTAETTYSAYRALVDGTAPIQACKAD